MFLFSPKTTDCGFFRWVEDVRKTNVNEWKELEGKLIDKERVIAHLEAEKKILEEKIKKLKMKRDILQVAMQDISNESRQLRGALCKYARGEKYALIAFVVIAYFYHCCNGWKLGNCWCHYNTKLAMDYVVMISLLTFTSLDLNDNS